MKTLKHKLIAATIGLGLSAMSLMASNVGWNIGAFNFSMGHYMLSPNGRFEARWQPDGNFVVYDNPNAAIWATGQKGGSAQLKFQSDGNLCIYVNGSCVWASGTWGNPGASLRMQDDGNLVIYRSNGTAAWATGTNRGGQGWHKDFYDDFAGSSVNTGKWYFNTEANFNGEQQCYTSSNGSGTGYNADVGGGTLKIRVLKNYPTCFGQQRQFSSSRLITKGRFSAVGGTWKSRLHVFFGDCSGVWPAWWLLGDRINEAPVWNGGYENVCWPMQGAREVDIFEWWGALGTQNNSTNCIASNACQAYQGYPGTYYVGNVQDWHTYEVNFSGDGWIRAYVDGAEKYANYNHGAPQWAWASEKFYTILNMAMGGNLGGSIYWGPGGYAGLEVDYVYHYSWY